MADILVVAGTGTDCEEFPSIQTHYHIKDQYLFNSGSCCYQLSGLVPGQSSETHSHTVIFHTLPCTLSIAPRPGNVVSLKFV